LNPDYRWNLSESASLCSEPKHDASGNRGSIGGLQNLDDVTFGFDPFQVSERYQQSDELLSEIIATLRPRGKVRRTSKGLWPRFCASALSGARFLAGFKSAEEFYAWVDVFNDDYRKLPALPLLLSKEISGFGFALACDFLKELGYFNLAKPDVHVRAIVRGLGLSEPKADDYAIYKAVLRIARHQDTTAYDVDKTFWLVGSGRFYEHPNIGRDGRVPSDRDVFIRSARSELDRAVGQQACGVPEAKATIRPHTGPDSPECPMPSSEKQRAAISPPLSLSFTKVYRAISEQPGAQTPELPTTGDDVRFVAKAKTTRDGRRFISLPHNNSFYDGDWGYTTNHMGKGGQRIGHYSIPLDNWARSVEKLSERHKA